MTYAPVIPRARLGFIIPSSNRVAEPDMQHYAPVGVVPHFIRIGMTNRHRAPLDVLMPKILAAADLLNDAKCDVIVFHCTGTSMSGGVNMDVRVRAEISGAFGKPAISTASALDAALAALDARKLVFISETAQEGHDKKKKYLVEAGYEIVADKAACLKGSDEYCTTAPRFWFDMAMALKNDSADAYFLSCANIHSVDVIVSLERVLGKPVVTSNQVVLWSALRTAGLKDHVAGLGKLFTRSG